MSIRETPGAGDRFITTASSPFGLAVDANYIYWTTGASMIARADLTGSNVNENFIGAAVGAFSKLAVDASYIYWTSTSGTIGRANLNGSSPNDDFITGISAPFRLAVHPD